MYIYLILNVFFFSFLSFHLHTFVRFIFNALFSNWHLALVLFSSLCFRWFCPGIYNFWFPLFTIVLECFDFAYGSICICVYSVTLITLVINLCLLCWAFAVLWSFPFFPLFLIFLFFSIFYCFNF